MPIRDDLKVYHFELPIHPMKVDLTDEAIAKIALAVVNLLQPDQKDAAGSVIKEQQA